MNSFILLIIGFVSVQETFAGWCNPYASHDCLTASTLPYPSLEKYLVGKAGPCVPGPNDYFPFDDYYCIVQTNTSVFTFWGGCEDLNPACAEGSENNITTTTTTTTTTTETPFQMPDPIDPTELCGNLSEVNFGLTEEEKDELLDIHNLKRSEVAKGDVTGQPAGLDLIKLVWDDELALTAQNHVNNCTFSHDLREARETTNYQNPGPGQNLAIIWSSGKFPTNLTKQFMGWFNEEADFRNVSLVDSFESAYLNGSAIGHYTQVVWGKTVAVGCGFIKFYDESDPQSKKYKHMLACNYGPTGNYIGQPVYTRGTPVDNSDCPTNYPTRNTTTMLCY